MKTFTPVTVGGVVDEMLTQLAYVEFIGGRNRAEYLSAIWDRTFPSGTQYDKLMETGQYRSKEENFRINAKRDGFYDSEVDAFLSL